jgi:hypothetical protein
MAAGLCSLSGPKRRNNLAAYGGRKAGSEFKGLKDGLAQRAGSLPRNRFRGSATLPVGGLSSEARRGVPHEPPFSADLPPAVCSYFYQHHYVSSHGDQSPLQALRKSHACYLSYYKS